jgi:cysteine-rich repeat protein
MGRRLALCAVLLGACNQIFGLDPGSGGASDGPPSDAPAGGDATDAAPDLCGNKSPDPGEPCDDGNDVEWDGCTNKCLLESSIGCADGTRDGFLMVFDSVAACAGDFGVAGLNAPRTGVPACLDSGDDGPDPDPDGCSAADLCAEGWSICPDHNQIEARIGNAPCGGVDQAFEPGFFATNQPSLDDVSCAIAGSNGIIGCGDVGSPAGAATCVSLTRAAGNLCLAAAPGWTCENASSERTTVVKSGGHGGGVLCCR